MFRFIKNIRKSNYVIVAILIVVYGSNVMFISLNNVPNTGQADAPKFAGSAVCAGCHKSIYESHIKTAHYLDSRPASKDFIKGSFKDGHNNFVYNKWMNVLLEQKEDRYFQTGYVNGVPYQSEPFDIVIGSGRKGQTYLYWDGNKLFQLPVSYYTPLNSWCNSPGYPTSYIKFNRIIPPQCLECHATYAGSQQDENNQPVYAKSEIVYGIDCERCHGEAAEHVVYQASHPGEKTAKYITSIRQLNRLQRLDNCALCHSGFRKPIKPAFTFWIGDSLDLFSQAGYNTDSVSALDVHGNQYGLLTSSKCYKMSALDCSSCHNVHVNEANNPGIFSQRCIACHAETKHESIDLPGDKKKMLAANCIDCHMPALPSGKIILDVTNTDKAVHDVVRTHRVGIYPEQSKEFLKTLKKY